MDYDNDFLGSYADENVTFNTQIVKTAVVGDNFWKVMIFTNAACTNYSEETKSAWTKVPGKLAMSAAITSDDYTEYVTNSKLMQWCSDLFDQGFTGDCIIVIPILDKEETSEYYEPGEWTTSTYDESGNVETKGTLEPVYNYMKPYAYHKTIFVPDAESEDNSGLNIDITLELGRLCKQDYQLLSGCPLLPYAYTDAEATKSPLYKAFADAGSNDAFFSACADETRNGSLVSLGIALAETNGSGTCVGNGMDMTSTSGFVCSGEDGENLEKSVRDSLVTFNVQTWKPVGNNTGNVAAYGEKTLQGEMYVVNWIIAYIAYMVKVGVAELLTTRNFLRNEANYGKILSTMNVYLGKFGPSGSGRLDNLQTTAPAFTELPVSDAETLVIPNAWSASYVGRLAKVQITGTLYLGE